MPIAVAKRRFEIEYSILHDVRPAGPCIGYYCGKAITEAVTDQFGHVLIFAGVALRTDDGDFDIGALAPGEFILEPGLIYRRSGF